MYENNPSNQDYPEVTPDAGTIEEPTNHKKAVATALGGSVVLGAAAYGLSLLDDGSGSEAPVSDDASSVAAAAAADARAKASLPIVSVSMPAEVDKLNWPLDRIDELTFEEAFAAARHQMGPAHHFNWHTGLYNTYYEQEEANLSDSARAAFIATLPGEKESASANEPEAPSRSVHPSGGTPRMHHAPAAADPQLAHAEHVDSNPVPVAAPVAAITVVPLAAVAEHEVTPLAYEQEETLLADQGANPMHHGSISGSSIDTVDQHAQFEHDSSHDDYHGMDQHHLGE
jgi:hypothetical protein